MPDIGVPPSKQSNSCVCAPVCMSVNGAGGGGGGGGGVSVRGVSSFHMRVHTHTHTCARAHTHTSAHERMYTPISLAWETYNKDASEILQSNNANHRVCVCV